ncbi:class A beta-lactamase [Aurantimonas sp. VKM B-3413]|uniref:class A beta-lactamase n=1 Tax=Aurantimonas sp. VKM B-3413 TaxID=2779401 RepID=UPI001E363A48|nr:class A beta-lactamase [Aurantimonas sp. VKM B-3413]MCB8837120.1 class A beta-lactamase [Aurantimonas sp. VKM B-3413]
MNANIGPKLLLAALLALATGFDPQSATAAEMKDKLAPVVAKIEKKLGARVGVEILPAEGPASWSHRSDERFPMASTSKAFACATLLSKVDAGKLSLDEAVVVEQGDILDYAPVTKEQVGQKMTLGALCEAATGTSDNTAINLVLQAIGGPDEVTRFLRGIGDTVTRLDRDEPELNEGRPGDPRDTTTPTAAATSLRDLVLGDPLSADSRKRLTTWLVEDKVAGPLLRSALPDGWRIADRSGAGGHGTRGIIAVIWPARAEPVIAAIYITGTKASMDERNRAIADIGKALVDALGH